MLIIKNLKYAYQNSQFDFSIEIESGSFLAIIGPSGAGKSTFLDLVAGFIQPSGGHISFNGDQINQLNPDARPVSMVFQENNLFTHLNVETNVGLGISPKLKLSASQHDQVKIALQRVGLQDYEKRLPGELSGGERQRVALARILVRQRPLLLLDEPFAALGPALRNQMLSLVKELHEEKKLTTILVSHQPDDAKSTATHTAFLNDGRFEVFEKTADFFSITDNQNLLDYQGS